MLRSPARGTQAPASPRRGPASSPRAGPSTTPASPGVTVTLGNGSQVTVPSSAVRKIDVTPTPGTECRFKQLWIFDSGWCGVSMVVALAKVNIAAIVHIKNSFAGFPKEALEEQMRGMPGGSHLEMKATVDGIPLICVATKYSKAKTLFICAVEGAGTTLEGTPFVTKWPDEFGNVHTREVYRPAVASRYFENMNYVDVHDHYRQGEVGLEIKWVPKGEQRGKFRIHCTVMSIAAVDSMIAVQCHSHLRHAIRGITTLDYIERLAEEMVDNEIDGHKSRPSPHKGPPRTVSTALELESEGPVHKLLTLGRLAGCRALKRGEQDKVIQLRCSVCSKKSSTYCTAVGCNEMVVCSSVKRNCFYQHCNAEVGAKRRRRSKCLTEAEAER